MNGWWDSMMHMLRLRGPASVKPDKSEAQLLADAKRRVAVLDMRADMMVRRSTKPGDRS